MHELDDRALEHVTAGKMPRDKTIETLEAYRRLANGLNRNGDRIGDAADAVKKMFTPTK